jgi:hypothetical protein
MLVLHGFKQYTDGAYVGVVPVQFTIQWIEGNG